MKQASNKEIRQARAYFYRRGRSVTRGFCRVFANAARVMQFTFADLDARLQADAGEA